MLATLAVLALLVVFCGCVWFAAKCWESGPFFFLVWGTGFANAAGICAEGIVKLIANAIEEAMS